MSDTTVMYYWRRNGGSFAFPATKIRDVDVLTAEEFADNMGCDPDDAPRKWFGPHDTAWHEIEIDIADEKTMQSAAIDASLGLCGDLTEIGLLCDAMWVSAAIHDRLAIPMTAWPEESMYLRSDLDSHDAVQASDLFRTIREVYGPDAEAAARRRYAA